MLEALHNWRQFPVRISVFRPPTSSTTNGSAFGYLYDIKHDMTDIIIHVSRWFQDTSSYTRRTSTTASRNTTTPTFTPIPPHHGGQGLYQIQLEDGDWVSFKTYMLWWGPYPIRHHENEITAPRENAASVPFPKVENHPSIWEPAPLGRVQTELSLGRFHKIR